MPQEPVRPVLLVHGTNDTSATMRPLADALAAAGREGTTLDYGRHPRSARGRFGGGGLGPLADSTRDVLAALDETLARLDEQADTSADPSAGSDTVARLPQVDLVGHSQGGLHALACARARPGRVAHVVLIGAPLHGVRPLGAASRVAHAPGLRHALDSVLGPSAREQVLGSKALGAGALPADGARHLFIASREDWVLRNVDPRLLASRPGWRTVWMHEVSPGRRHRHAALPSDPDVIALVLDELNQPPLPPRP